MNRTRQILKKSATAVLCASLILSGSSTAFAAGSYQETEKAALNKLTDGIPETWDTYLENYKKSAAGSKSNMTLKVEDTGRALIGALMGGTDVSIIVCGDSARSFYWYLDCSAAAQNILLAAESMGLGAVWTAAYPYEDRMEVVRKYTHLPENILPLCVIPFGYPATKEQPKQKYDEKKIHYNQY